MKNRKIVENVFYQASSFVDLIESKTYNSNDIFSKMPIYINCLFACELYLKAMLLSDGLSKKEFRDERHKLCNLYNMLDSKRRHEINNWMQNFHLINIFDFLDSINNDYVDVRYMYIENNTSKNMPNIKDLSQFMYKLQHMLSLELFGNDYYKKKSGEIL